MPDFDINTTDESLLEKAKEGDRTAFDAFYNRHKRRILNYIYRMTGNIGIAEEITQEAFVKAYMNLSGYSPQGKPLSWIYTISKNIYKNFLRDKKYEPLLLLDKALPGKEGLTFKDVMPSKGAGPSDLTMTRELEDLVQAHISRLPIKYREPLILCDMQGCSYEEAAGILNCRVGSVGSRLSRARLLLAKSLGRYFRKTEKGS